MIELTIPKADALIEQMKRTEQALGKSMSSILQHEAKEWSIQLHRRLKGIAKSPETIAAEAKARGFRMGRRSSALTPSRSGISVQAWKLADSMLGGEESAYVEVTTKGGVPHLKRVMFAKKRAKRLVGGRKGRRFSKSARTLKQLASEEREGFLSGNSNVKRLNRRAIATAADVGLRAGASRSSTMSVAFLDKVFRKRSSSTVKSGPLVSLSRTGKILGGVKWFEHLQGDKPEVGAILYSNVPGTRKQIEKRNLFDVIAADRTADRAQYIERELAKVAQSTGWK